LGAALPGAGSDINESGERRRVSGTTLSTGCPLIPRSPFTRYAPSISTVLPSDSAAPLPFG